MKAKSNGPSLTSIIRSSASSAGPIRRSIFLSTPASFQYSRARSVKSLLTSSATRCPLGGSASATQGAVSGKGADLEAACCPSEFGNERQECTLLGRNLHHRHRQLLRFFA